jgi:Zn-dependent protease with chaperone function
MKTIGSKWMVAAAVITIATVLGLCVAGPARAQEGTQPPERDPQKEQEILARLAEVSPGAVPIFERATEALDAQDWQGAQTAYRQVLSMAPGFPDALRRMSYVKLELGDLDAAVEYAQEAYDTDPSGINEQVLAQALLERATPADTVAGYRHAQAAAAALPDNPDAHLTLFVGALTNQEEDGMRQASAALLRLAPDNPVSHYCAGLSAAVDEKWEQAEREILVAQELGMSPEAVEDALDSGIRAQARLRRILKSGAYSVAGWLAGLGSLTVAGVLFSSLTLATVRRTQVSGEFRVGRGEGLLRNIYRVIIAVVSLYYYVSIPFLILIILALVVGIGYLFLFIGHIPLRLALFVGLAALFTLYSIVRSLFLRKREGDPGRPLSREEAPDLWSLAERVASKVGTRPIDAIYVSPTTELGVMERGGIWQKLRGGGERALVLGLGALPGMTQGQFQAILAHEYGHFSNRDTAGGNLAGQVRASLYQMAHGLAASGQARWYNPAWLFVNGFYRIYLRITLGASRLQEILADRYAAAAYGAANLIGGLQHMIHQDLVFGAGTNSEIRASIDQGRKLRNLYTLHAAGEAELPADLVDKEAEILKRPTSAYDSHPAPRDRFALLERLASVGSGDDALDPVWDLFADPQALQDEMTGHVDAILQARAKQSR